MPAFLLNAHNFHNNFESKSHRHAWRKSMPISWVNTWTHKSAKLGMGEKFPKVMRGGALPLPLPLPRLFSLIWYALVPTEFVLTPVY